MEVARYDNATTISPLSLSTERNNCKPELTIKCSTFTTSFGWTIFCTTRQRTSSLTRDAECYKKGSER